MTVKFVLASRSPRRRELLPRIGICDFTVDEADIDEESFLKSAVSPEETVRVLALAKARRVASRHPGALVIGADTVVLTGGRILGKPRDAAEAASMLRALSGRRHEVLSGVAICYGGRELCRVDVSGVEFRRLREREIEEFIRREPPYDKAGAYGIQGLSALFIRRIEGDFYNVMGLPLFMLGEMLETLGVELI